MLLWCLKSSAVLSPRLSVAVCTADTCPAALKPQEPGLQLPLVPHTCSYSRRKLPARVLAPSPRPQGRCSVLAAPQPQQAWGVPLTRAAAGSRWLQITELTSSPCPLPPPDNAPDSAARLASCRALNTVLLG